MEITHPYLRKRVLEVDKTEWIDIHYGLKATNVKYNDKILDLGAGSGGLIRYLREKGYKHVYGVDLLYSDEYVMQMDLTREDPPEADAYIFQHFLEHIPQDRALELLKYCYEGAGRVIGILPGHYSEDETHVVNHYTKRMIMDMIDVIQPKFYVLTPDLWSYLDPSSLDYLLILSRYGIRRFRPLGFRLLKMPLFIYLQRRRI